ncbi:MAG: hypothetical protein ABI261_02915 [Ginsengibacter sp.]
MVNYNTDTISRFIEAKTKYPEDAVSRNLSSLILVKITFKKNGDIDSIFSLNSQESEFSRAVINALKKSYKNLYKGINKIPLLIPVYFLHGDANDKIQINYLNDFRPENMKEYPFRCTYFRPVIIVSRSNIKVK